MYLVLHVPDIKIRTPKNHLYRWVKLDWHEYYEIVLIAPIWLVDSVFRLLMFGQLHETLLIPVYWQGTYFAKCNCNLMMVPMRTRSKCSRTEVRRYLNDNICLMNMMVMIKYVSNSNYFRKFILFKNKTSHTYMVPYSVILAPLSYQDYQILVFSLILLVG